MGNQSLTRIEKEASFSPSELQYLQANNNVQIHIKKRSELEDEVSDLITTTFYELGQKIEAVEQMILVTKLKDELILHFRWLTMEEVKMAFMKGARKEYGDYFGLNIVTFHNWIRSFQSDKKRADTLIKQNLLKQEVKKEPSAEELYQQSKAFALAAFETFKTEGYFNDIGNPVYEFLDSIQLIPFSIERKTEMFEQAKEKIKAKANPSYAVNANERTAFTLILEQIEANGKDVKERIRVEARKIALNTYFKELIEMETELIDLIENN
jgi:hypothetical protein